MKTSNMFLSLAALFFATCAHANGPVVLLTQGFNDVGVLDGWLQVNRSEPAGQPWFQGNPGIFSAHSGAADSYIGANFLSAQHGAGLVDNWLITPLLALAGPSELSFYTRSAASPGFRDTLEVRFGAGAMADPADFAQTLLTVGGAGAYPDTWQRHLAGVNLTGSGRFAFRYTGPATLGDYIGIDSVVITTVPEPASYALFGAGLSMLLWLRRGARRTAAAGLALAALGLASAAGAVEPQGMVVVRDPATGQLRAPTAAEFKALQAAAPPATARARGDLAASPPQLERRADGTRRAHLGDRATVYSVIRRDASGATHAQCVTGAEAAAAALNQSATHAKEHRHEAD